MERVRYFEERIRQGHRPFAIMMNGDYEPDPNLLRDCNNYILDGHHKLIAYQKLNIHPPLCWISYKPEQVSEIVFEAFWNDERQKEFAKLVSEENLSAEKTEKLIEDYLFAEREPLRDEVLELVVGEKPGVLQRKAIGDRILKRIIDFVETYINGMNLS